MTDKKPMARWKKIVIATVVLSLLLIEGFFPYHSRVRDNEVPYVVSQAIDDLCDGRRVWQKNKWISLKSLSSPLNATQKERLYFRHNLGISDEIFLKKGLKPIPKDQRLVFNDGGATISFSREGRNGKPIDGIRFSYVYDAIGGQGYIIRIRRSLFRRHLVYTREWIS